MIMLEHLRTEFFDVFARMEHRLKRSGFIRDRDDAQADWGAFAKSLGEPFFQDVVDRGLAETLISAPPAKLMSDLKWRRPQRHLANVEDLIVRGVTRVRNSLFHGEKFVGGPEQVSRDLILISEALAVLKLAEGHIERLDQTRSSVAGDS